MYCKINIDRIIGGAIALMALVIFGCSSSNKSTNATDTVAPAAVQNLAAASHTATSITLIWTAPGDDSLSGRATQYDIRYSPSPINESNWVSATQITGEPAPPPAGTADTLPITGLLWNTRYYFAMKTADEVPNWSGLSNVMHDSTRTGTWEPLGSGMSGTVNALAIYQGQLITGGSFTNAGGVPANNIAAWDGVSWSPLGIGTNGSVSSLDV